jgi:outer membrane protein OmpA-like peptidoglycan-associated protein
MKRAIIYIAILVVSISGAFSQGVYSTYFLDEWSQRHTLNASFSPEYGYLTLPILGGIELGVKTSVGMKNFIYPVDPSNPMYSQYKYTTFLNSSVPAANFLAGLPAYTSVNQGLKLNLLSFGFYTARKSFWSFDIYFKENLDVNLPSDFLKFAKLGMATSNNTYDLKNLGVEQSNMIQASLGYSRDILSNLRIGVNAKFLVGLSKVKFNYSKFDIALSDTSYSMAAIGESYIMSNQLAMGKDANGYYDFTKQNFNTSNLTPAGMGAAFDFGVTYKPFKHLTLAAAVNDIGVMKWNANAIQKGTATSNVAFSGFKNIGIDSMDITSQLDQLKTDASNLIKFKETTNAKEIIDNLPYTINASAELSAFANDKHDIRLGLLYQRYNSALVHNDRLVGALTLKPLSWIAFSGTYDIMNKDFNRYGVGISFSPRWINLYIAADYVTPKLNPQLIPIERINANISFGGSFVLGKPRDKDRDGITDRLDKCPDTPLRVKVDKHGCPIDTDKDGVADYLDKCPNTPAAAHGKVDANGCPLDSDGDGVSDYLDKCPNTPANLKVDQFGCPIDSDNDGVLDDVDKCPNTPAGVKVDSVGCPLDSDGDGVADYLDRCPNTPIEAKGKVDSLGCPLDTDLDSVPDYLDLCPNTPAEARQYVDKNGCTLDKDGDGIPDYLDKCPDTPIAAHGMVDENGCPRDTDGDGVLDYLDNCPKMPGVASNHGCPEIQKEVKTLIQMAQQGVQFETGKTVIKPNSFVILDKIVKVLVDNPTYLIEVRGHTDNVGNTAANLLLSQNRASAIRDYFLSKEIDAKRITANGFGDTLPVASNKTAKGRTLNRRVEFVITFEQVTAE